MFKFNDVFFKKTNCCVLKHHFLKECEIMECCLKEYKNEKKKNSFILNRLISKLFLIKIEKIK